MEVEPGAVGIHAVAGVPQQLKGRSFTRIAAWSADELESMFGRWPRGAWLAERVWEPDLPTSLVEKIVELASLPASGIERLALVAGRNYGAVLDNVAALGARIDRVSD